MKRIFDLFLSIIGLFLFSPVFFIISLIIWLSDFSTPFYRPYRMGMNFIPFKMYKFRTMILNADQFGASSTSVNDKRITPIGKIVRKFKLDELLQILNVFKGEMSFVGPRPQVVSHVLEQYTDEEKRLLSVRPGITDFSSIIFSDEGEILKDSKDPDKDYNKLIRPSKSELGLLYIEKRSLSLDLKLVIWTFLSILRRDLILKRIKTTLKKLGASDSLLYEAFKRPKSITKSEY